jgi:hypothetical protein
MQGQSPTAETAMESRSLGSGNFILGSPVEYWSRIASEMHSWETIDTPLPDIPTFIWNVTNQGWLETNLRTLLSQGDIYAGIPFGLPVAPLTHLAKGNGKKNAVIWTPTPPGQPVPAAETDHALFKYRIGHGVVVSHDCAIDKPSRTSRILFAPVVPLTGLPQASQEVIRRQAHLANMLIPDVPALGDAYADLKLITPIPMDLIDAATKVASMTDPARDRLQQALIAFLVDRKRPLGALNLANLWSIAAPQVLSAAQHAVHGARCALQSAGSQNSRTVFRTLGRIQRGARAMGLRDEGTVTVEGQKHTGQWKAERDTITVRYAMESETTHVSSEPYPYTARARQLLSELVQRYKGRAKWASRASLTTAKPSQAERGA